MAAAECPKCGKEVSDMAKQCHACGCRLYSDAEMLRPSKTRKAGGAGIGWKFLQFIGVLITIVGIMEYLSTDELDYSLFMVLVGLCIFILSRIAARWNHG